jgi:hypothetical protein
MTSHRPSPPGGKDMSGGVRVGPILFSSPMIRSILREIECPGTGKTNTRRLVDPARVAEYVAAGYSFSGRLVNYYGDHRLGMEFVSDEHGLWDAATNPAGRSALVVPIRYHPGQLLWVRESWAKTAVAPIVATIDNPMVVYREADSRTDYGGPWKPSIHMPRWASRITLEVTAVKIERLQDISEEDAEAEGCSGVLGPNPDFPDEWDPSPQEQFRDLWLDIHGPASWQANPWVVAVSFLPHLHNIDQLIAARAA